MTEQNVFLKGEIITKEDLLGIRNGYLYQHETASDPTARYQYLVAAGTIQQVLDFLDRGKVPLKEF